jgi:dolichol-phosphate mannosyltransferase
MSHAFGSEMESPTFRESPGRSQGGGGPLDAPSSLRRSVSFVIPVYRNRGTIRRTFQQIVELMKTQFPEFDFELVLVDDGSDDGSLEEILEVRSLDPRVCALVLSRNFGQLAAIVAGLRHTRANATVIMSADLQDPITLIGEMVREWASGTSIVVCYRVSRNDGFLPTIASWAFYRLIRLSNPQMPVGGFDYVLMDEQPARLFASFHNRNRFLQGDVLSLGFPTKFLPYHRQSRPVGKSQWTISKKLKYFIDGLIDTSYLPVRFMSAIGTLFAISGLFYAGVVAYIRMTDRQPFLGYAPLVILLLVCSGVLMIMLGVIGEYVWRIYDEVKQRPLFIVREVHPARTSAPWDGTPTK